jgi:hypothetical protein
VPDNGKRLAQELIVKDKVSFLGAGITPTAMAMAPLATEGKVATVVMISGTSVVTERSPYFVRTSFSNPESSPIGRSKTAARKQSVSSPTGRRAPRRARFSNSILPKAAAKSSIP